MRPIYATMAPTCRHGNYSGFCKQCWEAWKLRIAATVAMFLLASVASAQVHVDYDKAAEKAVKEGKPLIVFIGEAKERPVKGCVTVTVYELPGYPLAGVIVSKINAKKDWLQWVATLDHKATTAEIEKVVSRPVASPFSQGQASSADVSSGASVDALDEVNEARARRGLRPFVRDDGLMAAARAAASFRAERRIRGHHNDFSFLPAGSSANAAGCAAVTPDWGFLSCCRFENWTHAGAASVMGSDGLLYHHLFVR